MVASFYSHRSEKRGSAQFDHACVQWLSSSLKVCIFLSSVYPPDVG